MKNIAYLFLVFLVIFASCENDEWEFPDFDYQTVYFAHQYPVRTITLGEDIFDTSMDNEGKFRIMATTGGVYENKSDITIDVRVDNALLDGMVYANSENEIMTMPDNYYNLVSDQIVIPQGAIIGGVEVELTDAFFADPLAIQRNYVIPLRMTDVHNADSILSGVPLVNNPRRGVDEDWSTLPKDYIFYAVKYINPWHGFYLRRGEDIIEGKNGNSELDQTIVRQEEYVEDDEVIQLTTHSFNAVEFPLVFQNSEGVNISSNLLLRFHEDGSCTVEAGSDSFTATGTGAFVKRGEKNSWGNQDRDAIYLSYEIDLDEMHISATDTLVMRDRGVAMETFSPVLK